MWSFRHYLFTHKILDMIISHIKVLNTSHTTACGLVLLRPCGHHITFAASTSLHYCPLHAPRASPHHNSAWDLVVLQPTLLKSTPLHAQRAPSQPTPLQSLHLTPLYWERPIAVKENSNKKHWKLTGKKSRLSKVI